MIDLCHPPGDCVCAPTETSYGIEGTVITNRRHVLHLGLEVDKGSGVKPPARYSATAPHGHGAPGGSPARAAAATGEAQVTLSGAPSRHNGPLINSPTAAAQH